VDLDPESIGQEDPDPASHQSDENLRPLVYRPTPPPPPKTPFLSLHASIMRVHGPPWLSLEQCFGSELIDSDPDPAF
jgi:hypothetical protein